MEYRILGHVEVRAGGAVRYIGGPREQRAIAALLLTANQVVSVARLVEVLWADCPPATATTQIRNTVATLRRHLTSADHGKTPISRAGSGFVMNVDEDQLDVFRFDRLVTKARVLAGEGQVAAAAEALRAALALWQGPALDGLDTPALAADAHRLNEQRLACLERRIELDLALGRHQDLVGELAALVQEHPVRERLAELQITALYSSGRRQDALDAFNAARTRLVEYTGLDPRPELQSLQQAILRGDERLDGPAGRTQTGTTARPAAYPPAQLPADTTTFTGRAQQLAQLDAMLVDQDGEQATVVPIAAIAGTAGVGKTALAIHWAHRVRHRFSDGQLYVNLRGFDPAGTAVRPVDAIRGFLDALGVPRDEIPTNPDAQAGLYRSLLADRRVLVVLDNARNAEQVRPLLPGTPSCLVVVTSRSQLAGLVATEGARPIRLDLMSPAEARHLLTRRLGAARMSDEARQAEEIIARCGGLPLALVIMAARAVAQPGFPLAALTREPLNVSTGLDIFVGDDPPTNIRVVFSTSYHAVSEPAARLFRLLSLAPGPDMTALAMASLAGVSRERVGPLLTELTNVHLITEHIAGRYTLSNLLRAYASELARAVDTEEERQRASHRLFVHDLHTVNAASRQPQSRGSASSRPRSHRESRVQDRPRVPRRTAEPGR
jgi:DNA-binding SARP family transcriptional activator